MLMILNASKKNQETLNIQITVSKSLISLFTKMDLDKGKHEK